MLSRKKYYAVFFCFHALVSSNGLLSSEKFFSGLGYMVGSYVSSWFGSWNWGIRVTPVLGIVCLFSIIFVIKEPKRGEIEVAKGMSNASGVTTTSYLEDLKALCKM